LSYERTLRILFILNFQHFFQLETYYLQLIPLVVDFSNKMKKNLTTTLIPK